MKPQFILLLVSALLLAGCLGGGPPPQGNTTYTPPQLKYLLLDHYGENQFFYCDPDYYPVGRGDELERAIAVFPVIEKETDVFAAITARKGFQPPYSNDTILTIYREYKKLNAIPLNPLATDVYSFNLRVGTTGEGKLVTGAIRRDGVILGEQFNNAVLTCPICLAGDTLIDTPDGPVPVKDLREGMPVWTPGPKGGRVAVPLLRTAKTRVPPTHRLVHLMLSDGRELSASPGHPTLDGRALGTLSVGDDLDGSGVTRAELVPMTEEFTCDILPAGGTGGYWANGIPLRSTLFPAPPG
ncbi:MAG TPA: hypothetical protein VKO45_06490 [Methanomicrobiales archaeon]|nr:hypothetical protein [Methanomicrobiales archaeon]